LHYYADNATAGIMGTTSYFPEMLGDIKKNKKQAKLLKSTCCGAFAIVE